MHEGILRLIQYAFLFGVLVMISRAQNAEIYTVSDRDSRQLLELKLDLEQAQKRYEERKAAVIKAVTNGKSSYLTFSEDFKYAAPVLYSNSCGGYGGNYTLSCKPAEEAARIYPLNKEDADLGRGLWTDKNRAADAYEKWTSVIAQKLTPVDEKRHLASPPSQGSTLYMWPLGELKFNNDFTLATAEPDKACKSSTMGVSW